jgi:hypothetical protein
MAQPLQPNAFRYRDDSFRVEMLWRLAVAGLFVLDSLITGLWGIAALLHANWLDTNHLPVGDYHFWGWALLGVATVQGTTAVLLVVSRNVGSVLGIALAALSVVVQAGLIRAFPVDSIVGIAVSLLIIWVLVRSMHRS